VTLQVVGLGASGHARVVLEALQFNESVRVVGLLDPNPQLHGSTVLGVPVLGGDELLPALREDGISCFFVGLGSVGDCRPRMRLFELALKHGLNPVEVIHPRATVSPSAKLGKGVTILAGAVVNACAELGRNVILNTGAIVEHDCIVGDHVHIATGAELASTVRVGSGVHVGAGATVRQCIQIGDWATVGAGAVVVKDVPPHATVVGVPARPLCRRRPKAWRKANKQALESRRGTEHEVL